tara:strand:+ start:74 stop:262 length:189 start_codon:yes stop_codon:yes gene_type:complete
VKIIKIIGTPMISKTAPVDSKLPKIASLGAFVFPVLFSFLRLYPHKIKKRIKKEIRENTDKL